MIVQHDAQRVSRNTETREPGSPRSWRCSWKGGVRHESDSVEQQWNPSGHEDIERDVKLEPRTEVKQRFEGPCAPVMHINYKRNSWKHLLVQHTFNHHNNKNIRSSDKEPFCAESPEPVWSRTVSKTARRKKPSSAVPTALHAFLFSPSTGTERNVPRALRADDVTETAGNETQQQQARKRAKCGRHTHAFEGHGCVTVCEGFRATLCVHVPCVLECGT